MRTPLSCFVAIATGCLLAACGGSADSPGPAQPPGSGASAPVPTTASISGSVVAADTGEPLSGVRLAVGNRPFSDGYASEHENVQSEGHMELQFCVPASQRLADLWGVADDLARARDYCDFHIEIDPTIPGLTAGQMGRLEGQRQAFCRAAFISYGRASNTGVRTGVTSEMLERLPPHLRTMHGTVKALRDKWVAHAVNHFDDVRVVLQVEVNEAGTPIVEGVQITSQQVGGFRQAWMIEFRELCTSLLKVVQSELRAENDKVLAAARELSQENLMRLPSERAVGGDRPLRPSLVRARFKPHR
jgi:hypothetical protein